MKSVQVPDFETALELLHSFQKRDSLFARVRDSNASISCNDEIVIRERLESMEDWLDSLRDTGQALSLIQNDLVRLQTALTDYKLAHESALAPHKRLPPEVLSEIFLFAAEGVPAKFPLKHAEIRLRIAQVCSRWRRAALSTTHLWTDIDIRNDHPNQIRIVTQWLERTNSSSLKIRIFGTYHWVNAFSSLINPLSDRISVLDLSTVSKADQMLQQFALYSKNLIRIQFLAINVGYAWRNKLAFSLSPSLTQISLHIVGTALDRKAIIFPRASLVYMHLHSDCLADVALEVIHECPSLQDCYLSLLKIDSATLVRLASLQPKTLPYLRKLKVYFPSPDHYTSFLRLLTMPSLQSLLLVGRILTWSAEFVNLLSSGSYRNLQVLYTGIPKSRFDRSWSQSEELPIDCYRALHHLPSLQLVHFPPECPITDDTLAEIASGHLLPRLRRFHLHSGSLDAALGAITQRRTVANRIETAFISCTKKIHKRHRVMLENLQLSGSNVDVTSSSKLRQEWVMALFPSLNGQEETYLWNVDGRLSW